MDILFHDRDHEHARSLDNSKVTEVSAKATIKKLVPASYEEGRLMTDLEYFTFDHFLMLGEFTKALKMKLVCNLDVTYRFSPSKNEIYIGKIGAFPVQSILKTHQVCFVADP